MIYLLVFSVIAAGAVAIGFGTKSAAVVEPATPPDTGRLRAFAANIPRDVFSVLAIVMVLVTLVAGVVSLIPKRGTTPTVRAPISMPSFRPLPKDFSINAPPWCRACRSRLGQSPQDTPGGETDVTNDTHNPLEEDSFPVERFPVERGDHEVKKVQTESVTGRDRPAPIVVPPASNQAEKPRAEVVRIDRDRVVRLKSGRVGWVGFRKASQECRSPDSRSLPSNFRWPSRCCRWIGGRWRLESRTS